MKSKNLVFSVDNYPPHHTIAEMQLWPPPQGTINECFPLQLDLTFDCEVVQTPRSEIEVSLKGSEIVLVTENCSVVRGSRLGDEILQPYELGELNQSVIDALEDQQTLDGGVTLAIQPGFGGSLFAVFKRFRSKRTSNQQNRIINKATRFHRIICRSGNRWEIVEPLLPHLLRGRYLGETTTEGEIEKSKPLCLISALTTGATVKIYLMIRQNDISLKVTRKRLVPERIHRNQEAIINRLACREITSSLGLQPAARDGAICIGYATIQVADGD